MNLRELIKRQTFASAAREAILNLMVTNSWIVVQLPAAMVPHGMTPVHYSVLRILRGSHPHCLTCSEIGDRMVDHTPDVTRLLDRLERGGFIERARAEHDRCIVEVGISEQGIELLDRMNEDLHAVQQRLTRHLSESELRELSATLDTLRTDQ